MSSGQRWIALPAVLLAAACGTALDPAARDEAEAMPTIDALTAPVAGGGAVHLVRLVARAGRHAFEPDSLELRSGDVVRFVQTDYLPESVAFDTSALPAGGAEFLAREQLLAGPLLTEPGAIHQVRFTDAPPGVYLFFSVPHAELGMVGRIVVRE